LIPHHSTAGFTALYSLLKKWKYSALEYFRCSSP